MECEDQRRFDDCLRTTEAAVSRRAAMSSSGLALLGLLSGTTLCRAQERRSDRNRADPDSRRQREERIEQPRAFAEGMRGADMAERIELIRERRAQQRQRALEELKQRLAISDQEWSVIRPRLKAVYDLVHPPPQFAGPNEGPGSEVERQRRELRELLRGDETPVDQIKAKLTALRAAREKARQKLALAQQRLRELLTLRQEAELVLAALLD